ncbi:receptor-like protein EIX2 [Papaver somniferum]|uniref:receptor-like protein EIX2 n=1 Tax=Papaver somniferum TaxID=3469 RepID=UPI000E704CE9|nr:receptor-like protein EIX2 [Papaver somniferum]
MEEGGLGIRILEIINKALLMKLVWKIQNSEAEWAKFMRDKFTTIAGTFTSISIWRDAWIKEKPLVEIFDEDEYMLQNIDMKVADLIVNGKWLIPFSLLKYFQEEELPIISRQKDTRMWTGTMLGKFIVSLAVEVLGFEAGRPYTVRKNTMICWYAMFNGKVLGFEAGKPYAARVNTMICCIILCLLSSHGCHEEERKALLNFKSSLDDPSGRLSSWQDIFQHRNCCEWRGIGCSRESLHVVSIDLRNTKLEDYINEFSYRDGDPPSTALQGKLSPSLLRINHLEYLDLSFNDFQQSEIPFRFSDLTKLAHLDLTFTNFTTSISAHFSNVSSLQYLDLSCPPIEYFFHSSCLESPSTKWLRGLVNLHVLKLSGIDLFEATSSKDTFSEDVSYLSNLRYLDISVCDISSPILPIFQFQNLSHLSTLYLSSNDINSAIPIQLANLTSLSVLDLSVCSLHGSLPYLPQLKELDVSDNDDLHTDLTRMFEYRWPKLQILDISATEMTGPIPSSISNAPQLVSLSAAWCSIQGSLPFSIYNLSRLQRLDLDDSKITSYIHSSISNLKELNYLDLSFNNFQGPIPESICKIVTLQYLDLGSNNITGTIPSCITKLQNLGSFDVSKNSITGTVSLISLIDELSLTTLDLSSNNLTVVTDQHLYPTKFKLRSLRLEALNMQGFIPTSICNLTRLKYLGLSSNNLTGAIPSCISKLKNLNILDLSKNRLSGHLPPVPPSVNNLYLSNNELSGSIPSSICSQKPRNTKWDLIIPILIFQDDLIINLSRNKLSGIVPYSIGYCTNLIILDISNNNLTGNVPNELQHTNLIYLALSDNNLNGPFPMLIRSLLYLRVLNLRNNKFEGNIPVGLGSLERLAILSLRSNRFNGSIPNDIIHLQELRILDLSLNDFSGPIPLKLGNLTTLTSKLFISTDGITVPLSLDLYQSYTMQYQVSIKGTMAQFEMSDIYSLGIDLSCNFLTGNIPQEIGLLEGLAMLNLSHNLLSGNIPSSVGNMSSLESLDLSCNRLSGHIPQSLTSIDSLGFLNLSNNNFTGRIPRASHFDTLSVDGYAFVGNDLLCGFPLEKVCDRESNVDIGDTSPSSKVEEDDQDEGKEKLLLYAIVALGCAVGFWGLFFVLLLNKQNWWFPYWRNIDLLAVNIVERCIR